MAPKDIDRALPPSNGKTTSDLSTMEEDEEKRRAEEIWHSTPNSPFNGTLQRERRNPSTVSNLQQSAPPMNFGGGVAGTPPPGMTLPVQMTFSGPASIFINVFRQPGEYTINLDFQSQQPSQQGGQPGLNRGPQSELWNFNPSNQQGRGTYRQ